MIALKTKAILLCLLALLLLNGAAMAQSSKPENASPVILTDAQGEYPLGLHLELLEDPGGQLSIEDVTSPAIGAKFLPSQSAVPNYGFTDSAIWVRLDLRNETLHADQWLLEQGFANTHFVDLFTPLPDGTGYSVKHSGVLRSPSNRDVSHPNVVFNLEVPPGEKQTYYLRIQNGASMTLPLTLWTEAEFLKKTIQEQLWMGIFYGALIALLFYNLFLLFSLREVSYLYFVILLASTIIEETTYDGYFMLYIAPRYFHLADHFYPIAFIAVIASIVLFADTFLELKVRLPKLHAVNRLILIAWAALALLSLFLAYHSVAIIALPLAILSMVSVLAAGFISLRGGYRPARFFLLAWLGMLIGLIWVFLVREGILPSNLISENAYRIGILWMAICWSLALADRINLLKTATESANRSLRDSEHRLAQILDGLPLGVVLYGKDQKPKYANRRTYEIMSDPTRGVRADISAGRTLRDAIPYFSIKAAGSQEVYDLERFPVINALQGQPAAADDIEMVRGDERVALEIQASPVMGSDGIVESAVVAIQDISLRKQAERALRTSETRFRVIAENNFDGIAFMGGDRKVLYASTSYLRLVGKTAEELIGQSGVGLVHPDDREYTAAKFNELLQQPRTRISAEYRIPHKDGSWIWVETYAINLLDDPDVQAVVVNSHNITERKETEAELAEYRKHLERLVEKRTEELSVINEQLTLEAGERQMLERSLQHRIEWLSAVNRAHQAMAGVAGLTAAYRALTATMLKLLDARLVFIVRWDGQDELCEINYAFQQEDLKPEMTVIQASFSNDSALRRELESGRTVTWAVDQAEHLPEALQSCIQEHGLQSAVLAPLIARQNVTGLLGVAQSSPVMANPANEVSLVERMALDLADLAEDAILLDQALALATLEERNRLARDLHDSVTQVLFSASLLAEVLPQVWQRDPEQGYERLERLRTLTRGALAEMRTMLLELRPSAVIHTPLHDLLGQLAEAVTSRSGLRFDLNIEQIPLLPEEVHVNFYRVAQEALNNVVKHAQAEQVFLRLSAETLDPQVNGASGVEVTLLIRDDGVGFSGEERRSGQLGIGIMQERAAAIRARLVLESQPGYGTQVALIWRDETEKL